MNKPHNKKIINYMSLLFPLSSAMLIPQVNAVEPVFKEVSSISRIAGSGGNNQSGGVAWIDINNDTYPDLYILSESGANRLYLNNKGDRFDEIIFSKNVQLASEKSLSVAIGDYNGDGFDDIFVGNNGGNTLLKNNGNNTFSDVTPGSGLDDFQNMSNAASFGDIDNDGDLDIYVGHWAGRGAVVCAGNDLYLNQGSGQFINVSVESGSNDFGCTFSVAMTDFDQDGDLDIFLPNDTMGGVPNDLLRNDGVNSNNVPVFSSIGVDVGVGQTITGMGIAIGDIDNDGDIDFYRTRNGAGLLSIKSSSNTYTNLFDGDPGIGWGAAFFDANNDGYLDLYRGNSAYAFNGSGEANTFYLNNGKGAFATDSALNAGLLSFKAGLGLAYADYDKDGDMDVVVQGTGGVVNLFRNDTPAQNYLSIALKGSQFNHRGIGARVFSTSTDGATTLTQMREIHAGSSHSSNHDAGVHFGLANHTTVDVVKVIWPDGCVQEKKAISANQILPIDRVNCSFLHTISGLVFNALEEVIVDQPVQIMDLSGTTFNAVTNTRGEYAQKVPDGLYVTLLNSTEYDFKALDNTGGDLVEVKHADAIKNYFATPKVYSISGTVLSSSGVPVAGVTVQVRNSSELISDIVTDVNGAYTQDVPNGTYLINLTSVDYYFNAVNPNPLVSINGANETRNYTAILK